MAIRWAVLPFSWRPGLAALVRPFTRKVVRTIRNWRPPVPLGLRGERAAARFLRRRGHKIVARRARDRLGEIDLVTVEGRTVVFVEVKTRRSKDAGEPSDAVDARKQMRLSRVALSFLRRHELLDNAVRFDIVSVYWPKSAAQPAIQHIEQAFEPAGRWQMHA